MLAETGATVKPNPVGRRLTEGETIAHLQGVDGLLAGLEPLNRAVLESAAPRLKAIARVGVGMTNVDIEAARELGIRVSSTPDGPASAVAEMTVGALLALARNLIPMNEALHGGVWKKMIGFGLEGTSVLLIGYGHIGRRVARLIEAFGARVLWYDPHVEATAADIGARVARLENGLAEAAVVSLHAAGTDCILGSDQFAGMRDGVVLLNAARGELVDEAALVAALDMGKVGAAWFDAFWSEPYEGPLTRYPQVLLTPHAGTYTRQCRRDMEIQAVRNLLRDLEIA
ncbi:MAG TPA: NAD(P)-dependent oxidoreductase [Candidatus Hydrogenedentes bacterium]|nr:NAD(P)-dependent oxidoreductase [Candidatus Hydrogenedentota bacterium]